MEGCLPGSLVPGRPDGLELLEQRLSEGARASARTDRRRRGRRGRTAGRRMSDTRSAGSRSASACSDRAAPPPKTCPVRVAPTRADAESQRTLPGRARVADSAITDDVSKTDRSCRADSALSSRPHVADRVPGRKTVGRQAPCFFPNGLPFLAESRHVERRGVDRCGNPGRGPLQTVQHLIDGVELSVSCPAGPVL